MESGSCFVLKISIVIPSYNGWDRIPALCYQIISTFSRFIKSGYYEIIIVDDGSIGRSDTIIMELRNTGINVRAVFLNKNYGQQFATLAGLIVSRGEYIITADDDLSHHPDDFEKLLFLIEKEEMDVIFAVPENDNKEMFRKRGSVLRDIIFKLFFNKPKEISVSSFRVLSRSLVNKIIADISEYRYLSVEILKHTRFIADIKVKYRRNPEDNSRYSLMKLLFLLISLIRCSRIFPQRVRKLETASEMEWYII
jgi:polyisoprenyl-phosphate glycosyltransferase